MNEVLSNIYARRSVRSYSAEAVPEDAVMEVIKAGTYAPSGMNAQGLRFVVVSDRAVMDGYSKKAKEAWQEMAKKAAKEGNKTAAERLEAIAKRLSNPSLDLFHGAPLLIFVFTAPNTITPVEDGSLAAENMMLAARSLGLGSCWIGFAAPLANDPQWMAGLGVPADHKLIAPLVFGFPKAEAHEGKKDAPKILKWVR